MMADDWEVHVHLVRITADLNQLGHATPEGIHRDGAEFVTVHLRNWSMRRAGRSRSTAMIVLCWTHFAWSR